MGKMLFVIMEDVIAFFEEYALKGSLLGIIVAVSYLLNELYFQNRRFDISVPKYLEVRVIARKVTYIFLLTFYLYIVIGITILSRSESGTREASFQLFRTFQNTFLTRKQIYENIIMFVPYAMLLYGLAMWFRSKRRMLLIGAGSSLLIEKFYIRVRKTP